MVFSQLFFALSRMVPSSNMQLNENDYHPPIIVLHSSFFSVQFDFFPINNEPTQILANAKHNGYGKVRPREARVGTLAKV